MDLHPYDTKRHDTTRHDSCHAPMHGLIHDNRYGHANHAFRVMYVFRVNVHS
jgi:hypothetical protein